MYTLKNITKHYGGSVILSDITIDLPTNEFVFILGPSGAGKSTLLRLLSFVELPSEGKIELQLGQSRFSSLETQRPWPHLTTVFQRQFLWPHLTVRENVTLPLKAQGARDIEGRLKKVIRLFDMDSFLDRYPNEVSGGEAQRAALARALILEPKLVLIDEAHGGLDLIQQKVLNAYLLKLRSTGVGLIIVTHSIDFAKQYADRVVVLEKGQITESGGGAAFERPTSSFLKGVLQ